MSTQFDERSRNQALTELSHSISQLDPSKSFTRHSHWKSLLQEGHSAKICLLHLINSISKSILQGNNELDYQLLHTNLSPIPKKGKKDLSLIKSWRPISIGTSECWLWEKMFQQRLSPYLQTYDCQFGYKAEHSTSHAIQIVRVIERERDVHACLLDASSAFDRLSWFRIRDSFVRRKIPFTLTKLIVTLLSLTKISVCKTRIFFR